MLLETFTGSSSRDFPMNSYRDQSRNSSGYFSKDSCIKFTSDTSRNLTIYFSWDCTKYSSRISPGIYVEISPNFAMNFSINTTMNITRSSRDISDSFSSDFSWNSHKTSSRSSCCTPPEMVSVPLILKFHLVVLLKFLHEFFRKKKYSKFLYEFLQNFLLWYQ